MTERAIFFAALDIDDPTERVAYLDRACGADDSVRRRVDRLLKAHTAAGQFLRPLIAQDGDTHSPTPDTAGPPSVEGVGGRVGPYKLLEKLGEGGMGAVYLAEQEWPVRRPVALKVIRPGMDSAQVAARFEQERQALALMDHPNIAKILDAGAIDGVRGSGGEGPVPTPDPGLLTPGHGRPYFVMELVRGPTITRFCDDNRLSLRERLELFVPVCHAVQHAHQKGVIHRDIKPSNILVALADGQPVPKVIDFGIAKALDQRLTDKTLVTSIGQVIGTLEYMAPEQAKLNALDVDTRSDVYALGVLLYELLTGTTPFDRERLRGTPYDEVLRLLREEEPPAPSTRLATTENLFAIAAQRQTEPGQLSRLVKGELDWIVLKALEKDRNRRYESASGLARDVQRYLNDEPVTAGPPSAAYRLRKFARRNKAALVTTSMVAAALVVGTAVAIWQAVVATRAKQDAFSAAAAATTAKETAEAREAETLAVLKFVENKIFAAARPKGQQGGLGHDVPLRQALEAALKFVDESFPNEPLIEARLRMTLGRSFYFLGESKTAGEQYQKALALYGQQLGPDHPDTLRGMHFVANSHEALGQHADALKLREQVLALRQHTLGSDHPDTLQSMNNLANSYGDLNRHQDAIRLHEQALAPRQARLGPDHPDTLQSMSNLAISYYALGRHPDALRLREQVLALRQAKSGPDHPDTLLSMNNLANSYRALGRHSDALRLHEQTLALKRARLGPDHPDTLVSMNNVAVSYAVLGRHADALRLREETLALQQRKLGPDHPDTLRSMHNLANSYAALGRHSDALKLREETLALRKAKHGPDHPATLNTMHYLADSYAALDRHAEAIQLREETLALRKARLSPDHPDTLISIDSLAETYLAAQRWADAEPLLREALRIRTAKQPDHWLLFRTQSVFGACLTAQKRYTEAEPLLLAGYEGMTSRAQTMPAAERKTLAVARERIIQLYDAWGQPDRAAEWGRSGNGAPAPVKPGGQ